MRSISTSQINGSSKSNSERQCGLETTLTAELHTRFVKIHPFVDGNGKTGRLLLNSELMKFGYPPAVIRKEDRLAYYDSLDEACVTGNYSGITQLVAASVQRALGAYLDVLGLREDHRPNDEPPLSGTSIRSI